MAGLAVRFVLLDPDSRTLNPSMKPIYEKLTQFPEEGFALKEIRGTDCSCPWHFHPECELILVLQTRGYRIVGDNVTSLEPGDLVLLGANVPHIYQQEDQVVASRAAPHCILLQFEERNWVGLFELPALAGVRSLLQRAATGLRFTGRTRDTVAAMMTRMVGLRGVRRVAAFLQLLDALARCRNGRPIASPGFAPALNPYDEERVNHVWQYINQRLEGPLSVPEVARRVHMSEGAFSRYFRSHMGKTFPALVNELRIGRACRLLAETEMSVTEVALACGYGNLSNFNRQFLRLKQTTPRAFRCRMTAGARP
jgi:AraC-like DNA-binding protein